MPHQPRDPQSGSNLIRLAERWRVVGAEMRRKDPRRYVRHLHALELRCVDMADEAEVEIRRLI